MVEEFHGNGGEGGTWIYKLYYGWGTLNTNVWLPSLSELVGVTGAQSSTGVYLSAMQGISTSDEKYWTDAQGGPQFAYFAQYNASGGGEKIWEACNQESSRLRSTNPTNVTNAWRTTNATTFNTSIATAAFAVHPAVGLHNTS